MAHAPCFAMANFKSYPKEIKCAFFLNDYAGKIVTLCF